VLQFLVFFLAIAAVGLLGYAMLNPPVKPVPVVGHDHLAASDGDWFDDRFVQSICDAIEKRDGVWVSAFEVRQVLRELGERGHLLVIEVGEDEVLQNPYSWVG
jgi:hypothetical protein